MGFGTQDTFGDAEDFVARHDVPFKMLWDSGFESWEAFGISRQPAAVLLAPDGTELDRWQGELSESDQARALELARQA
ncbi:MAG: TlpA family protein disulfide reductase [Acidimicrobiia bacterium]